MSDNEESAAEFEERIHNSPSFVEMEAAYQSLDAVLGNPEHDAETQAAAISQFIDADALFHFSGHQLRSAADHCPAPLVLTFATAFQVMWAQGFLVGQRVQARRDAELMSITVPDSPAELG